MLMNLSGRFRRITTGKKYFPEIDGIRFIAIASVVLFHIHGYFLEKSKLPHTPNLIDGLLENGNRGVVLFFVLSGFMVSLPFAKQYLMGEPTVDIKKYYLRRFTRIEPPYIIAITLLFLFELVLHINPFHLSTLQQVQHYIASVFYSHGAVYHHMPTITAVAWSLEVEIQFYLVAPLVFNVFRLPALPRRLLLVGAIVFFSIAPLYFPPTFRNLYGYGQYFAAGVLLADFYVSGALQKFFSGNWSLFLAPILFITIFLVPLHGSIYVRLVYAPLIACFFYLILSNLKLRQLFSYRFIPIVGGMCYSIYLLHTSVISFFGRFTLQFLITEHYSINLLVQSIIFIILILLVSGSFYLVVERPFMAVRFNGNESK